MQQQSAVPTSVVPSSVKCSIVTKAFELKCYRRIPYTDHITNEEVLRRVGQSRALLGRVICFGHISHHTSLEKDIMLGPVAGTWRQGGQRRQWLDDITKLTLLERLEVVHLAEDRICHHEFVHRVAYTPHRVW